MADLIDLWQTSIFITVIFSNSGKWVGSKYRLSHPTSPLVCPKGKKTSWYADPRWEKGVPECTLSRTTGLWWILYGTGSNSSVILIATTSHNWLRPRKRSEREKHSVTPISYILVQKKFSSTIKFLELVEIKNLSPDKEWTHIQRRKLKHNKTDYS